MATASTKQRDRKSVGATMADGRPFLAPDAPENRDEATVSETAWLWGSVLILLAAALLRVVALELKPLHHDEGVNAFFLTDLLTKGEYRYNPENYHGPTLYYFALPLAQWFGMTTTVIRLVPVIFGVATVWLVLCLRRYLGTTGTLAAAALVAVSPGAVYYSRYFIHESLFVFFTLGVIVAALRYYDTARPRYLMLAAVSAGLLFATKETAFISAGVILLAALLAEGFARRATRDADFNAAVQRTRSTKSSARAKARTGSGANKLARFGDSSRIALLSANAVAVFIIVNVVFYSSFFSNSQGVTDALGTFKLWAKRTSLEHAKPIWTYIEWLAQEEAAILLLATTGAAYAVLRPSRRRFPLFACAWAFGLLAAYSLIGYKTPWLALNFIVPLALASGYAVGVVDTWAERVKETRWPAALLMGVALALGLYQSVQLNFYHYDDERYPYVYVHTRREVLQLVSEIDRLAASAGTGKQTTIAVASSDYWPLPWYLSEYTRVAYHGRVAAYTDQIVIGRDGVDEAILQASLGSGYVRVGETYPLRPGVNLVLYVRRELAAK
ncbi:MAG TPA: flippase activity-associated protein Agl23 [Pyrinomonadaceae bacterium]|nr:flippase activity-associated protein Agl23 [Pyrinomonadaceae bacterium]